MKKVNLISKEYFCHLFCNFLSITVIKMKKKEFLKIGLVFALFIMISLINYNSNTILGDKEKEYGILKVPLSSTSHSPILIDGNTALDTFCATNGTTGLTPAFAHVIKDYEIDCNEAGTGIEIRNTNRYLVILNCSIIDYVSSGIKLDNCTNVNITLNDAHKESIWSINQNGVYLYNSSHNVISYNNLTDNNYGILLSLSEFNNVSYNKIEDSDYYGIELSSISSLNNISCNKIINSGFYGINCKSHYVTIISNNFTGSGNFDIYLFWASGMTLSNNLMEKGIKFYESSGNLIDTTNLVDGKPVYYYEDESNLNIEGIPEAGMLILVQCENLTIKDMEISHKSGVQIMESYNITILNLTSNYNGEYGIYLEKSNEVKIFNSSFSYNGIGVKMINSYHNKFYWNEMSHNSIYGVNLRYSYYNEFSFNDILDNNFDGVYLDDYANYNDFIGNFISQSDGNGIFIEGNSDYNTLIGNTITFNSFIGIYLYEEADNNQIWLNNMADNFLQAQDNGTANEWDNGSIGNYWGDYSLFNPTASNVGGIWDLGYSIFGDADSTDSFPLVYPSTIYNEYPFPLLTPTANFETSATEIVIGQTIEFTDTSYGGNLPLSYEWNFGDGTINSTEKNPDHQFNVVGDHTITLMVSDVDGSFSLKNDVVIKVNADLIPTVDFSANVTEIKEGESVEFTDLTTSGNTPLNYQWNFGDGSSNSTEKNPVHQFNSEGVYTVSLTVVDSDGDLVNIKKTEYIIVKGPSIPGYVEYLLLISSIIGIGMKILLIRRKSKRPNLV